MARNSGFEIEVEGAKELAALVRKTKDKELRKALKAANKAAGDVLVPEAKQEAPERTGRLARSIKSSPTNTEARLKVGSPSRVPYAGPIHFGWAARNIRPQPFVYDAISDKWRDVMATYEKQIQDVMEKVDTTLS